MSYRVDRFAEEDTSDLQSLSGMPGGSTDLGTFTGNTIPDNQTTKQALQSLETEVDDRLPDFVKWQRKSGGYYFAGSAPHLIGPDIPSFTDGTDDLPGTVMFTTDVVDGGYAAVTKFGASSAVREWGLVVDLRSVSATAGVLVTLTDTSGNSVQALVPKSDVISIFDGSNATVAAVYAGTTAANFATAGNNITIYINGEAYSATVTNNASYTGMSDTSQPLWVGRASSTYATECSIREVRLFNCALTGSDVVKYSRGDATAYTDRVTTAIQYDGDFDDAVWNATGTLSAGAMTFDAASEYAFRVMPNMFKHAYYRITYTVTASTTDGDLILADSLSFVGSIVTNNTVIPKTTGTHSVVIKSENRFTTGGVTIPFRLINSTSGLITLSNVKVEHLGEMATYYPESSTPTIWADSSPFGGHLTNSNASMIPRNALHADAFVSLTNLPTSSAGLAAGRVWKDGEALKVV